MQFCGQKLAECSLQLRVMQGHIDGLFDIVWGRVLHGWEVRSVHSFTWKTWRKKTTWQHT